MKVHKDNNLPVTTSYDPNKLLDAIIEKLGLKNDAALSRALDVAPPVISKIRHGTLPVGASILIRMQDASNLSLKKLRAMSGDRRKRFRIATRDGQSDFRRSADSG